MLVAFSAETGEVDIAAAKKKLKEKGAHLIFLNNVSNGAIFGADKTSGYILDGNGLQMQCLEQNKDTLADLLLDQALIKLG